MRPVLHSDVVIAARALLAAPRGQRQALVRGFLRRAVLGDGFRQSTGKIHPIWGDGSLEGAARLSNLAPEPYLDDPEYCRCLITVFEMVLRFRLANPLRS